jgi:hypothetical protein
MFMRPPPGKWRTKRRALAGISEQSLGYYLWVILILGGPIAALRWFQERKITSLVWVAAIAPVCLPLPNLLSVKYAVPLLMFFPAILVACLSSAERAVSAHLRKWPLLISGVATVALLLFSASLYGRAPYLMLGTRPSREVGTHDGTRSYGGYFWQMLAVERGAEATPHQKFAQKVLGELREVNGPDIVVAGDENFFNPGGAGWRDLQLSLEADGIHGSVVAPHTIQFELNGRRLTLIRDVPAQIDARLDRGRGLKVYDLREKPRDQ